MNVSRLSSPRYVLPLLLLLYVGLVLLTRLVVLPSPSYTAHTTLLHTALLFDFTVWPLAGVYFLIARSRGWSVGRVGLVGVGLLRLAMAWIPGPAPVLGWPVLLIILEAGLLTVAIWRFRTVSNTYRLLRRTQPADVARQGALAAIFGSHVAHFILAEGTMLQYALLGWWLPTNAPAGATPLTTHRNSGQLALLWGLLLVTSVEVGVGHLLLLRWWPAAAFWATGLSFYGCLVLLALLNTSRLRPSYCTPDALHLRLDLRWQAVIPFSRIASLSYITDTPPKQPGLLNAALLTTPNVLLIGNEPLLITGLGGWQRQVTQLTFFLDEPARLLTTVR